MGFLCQIFLICFSSFRVVPMYWCFFQWSFLEPRILWPSKPGRPGVNKKTLISDWVVVSNIFYIHPYLGKWSNLTIIFSKGVGSTTNQLIISGSYCFPLLLQSTAVKPLRSCSSLCRALTETDLRRAWQSLRNVVVVLGCFRKWMDGSMMVRINGVGHFTYL